MNVITKTLLFTVLSAGWLTAAEDISVFYSPNGGCTEAIVAEIEGARTSVYVLAYSFTSKPISVALVNAAKRGVQVSIVLDKSQKTEKYSGADFVAHAGIPTWIDSEHAIAHNKVMVIDAKEVITGSFNFTSSAESRNAENLLIIRRPDIAAKYKANWDLHQAHAEPYAGK